MSKADAESDAGLAVRDREITRLLEQQVKLRIALREAANVLYEALEDMPGWVDKVRPTISKCDALTGKFGNT